MSSLSPTELDTRLESAIDDFIAYEWRHAGIHATPEMLGHVNEDRYAHRDELRAAFHKYQEMVRLERETSRALADALLKSRDELARWARTIHPMAVGPDRRVRFEALDAASTAVLAQFARLGSVPQEPRAPIVDTANDGIGERNGDG